jgi:hypothetical protein
MISKLSDLNVVDVHLAEYQESIMHAIPQMFIFLQSRDRDRLEIINTTEHKFLQNLNLSEHGKISSFLT